MLALIALTLVLAQEPAAPAPQLSRQSPSAAAKYVGQNIVQAEIYVEGQLADDPMLLGLLETAPGTPLSMASVRETIAHLYSLGRFVEASVDASAVPGGVRLRFDLTPLHNVEEIEFTGELGLGRGDLRRAVTERFGAAPPASRAGAAAELLQRYYFERGYLDAAIRPALQEQHAPDRTVLTFEVQSGPRAHVRNARVNGDPGEPHAAFLAEIHANPGRAYQLVVVQERLSNYIQDLRRDGWYEASGSHRMAWRSDDGRSVDLEVTVERGRSVAITFEGDPLPKNKLDELVPVRTEGSVDIDIIEDSEQRIVSYLNQDGYWKAQVTSSRRETDGRLEIVFIVKKGLRYKVQGGVEVSGNASVPLTDLQPALQALQDGDRFLAGNLDAAASAVRAIYLQRGFAQVKVESAANELPAAGAEGRVKPVISITEGPQLRIGEITFAGNSAMSTQELRTHLSLSTGSPYYEPQVVRDRDVLAREYLNRGFQSAGVEVGRAIVENSRVNLTFTITEGTQTFVDHVLIVGNVKTKAEVIERELGSLQPGQPLGLSAIFEARRRLSELGLFRRVRIDQIVHGDSGRRDLLIDVQESPSTAIGYGAGLEVNNRLDTNEAGVVTEKLELAPRGFFEIGRRNIGGKNRSINLYTRLSLRSDNDPQSTGGDLFGFPEYRVVTTYREPKTFGWDADVAITAAVEQGERTTFKFARKGVNAEIMRRLSPEIRTSGRYTLSATRTFDEVLNESDKLTIDRLFPQVRLSAFSAVIARDTRDDLLEPSRGFFTSAEGTLAARSLGGQVGFIKSYVQGSAYRRLPIGRRVVIAARVALGLADGFPREVTRTSETGEVTIENIEDLPASERFFAGGDTTVRGFALDTVGTDETLTASGLPIGGNGLVLANLELRVPIWGDVGGAFFVDGGNVFERASHIDLGELRWSVGFGVRYRSPIGPLRFDVGFKMDPITRGTEVESRRAFHFSFGQAF